ncbi:MAG: MOSC domain-containing protein [Bacteroidetes bacterium]|nr:MOSC domain-containing protein [Bacteroidota bacterium]MBU1720110.1 MOSC domain-containing protein [Bacteroidota bacterium]
MKDQVFTIHSVNISEKKGTVKNPVAEIQLLDEGISGDAHSGKWHRQISLLGIESVKKFSEMAKREIQFGEFAENITTEGVTLYEMKPLDRLTIGEVVLEVTQIGKKCHGDKCAIYREVGNCVMPKEGIFCRVLKHGTLKAGMSGVYKHRILKTLVLTLSDRASTGEYSDRSGPKLVELLNSHIEGLGYQHENHYAIIPDEKPELMKLLKRHYDEGVDFIFTTGGTGIAERDITPDVVAGWIDKEIPGIMEMIRTKYGASKPSVLLSRSIAGVRGNTCVYTLPGSVRAVEEYCNEIFPLLHHSLLMLNSIDAH